jgi:hypothetical protein
MALPATSVGSLRSEERGARSERVGGERRSDFEIDHGPTRGAQRHPMSFERRAAPSRLTRRVLIDHWRCTCERASAREHRNCSAHA